MAILAIILVIILLVIIVVDIRIARIYRDAFRTTGTVLQCEGSITVKNYGEYQYRKYWKYLIAYQTRDGMFKESIPIRDGGLKVGDQIEVRYTKNSTGTHLLDDTASRRIKELLISFVIALVFSTGIIYAKAKGFL